MKILLLLTDLFGATGGIQTFNRSLVRAIDEISSDNDWQSNVFALNDSQCGNRVAGYFNNKRTRYRAFNRSKSKFLASAMKEARSASIVILGHVNFAPMSLGLRARNSQLQILLTVFGIDVWNKLTRLQLAGLRNIQRIISISKSTQLRMTAANNVNGTPIDILPCTLEPHYGHGVTLKSRTELGLPDGPMILSTSRLDARERYKGIEKVVRAMPNIIELIEKAFYVIVGDGTDRKRLEHLAGDLAIRNRVIFSGQVQDARLASLYNTSDLFVLPSTGEGFGIVFLEAMFYAKCCVGARAAATPEVIQDGETGVLINPEDPQELANAITSLLVDDDRRRRMGAAGQQRLATDFSQAMFTQRLKSILGAQ